VDLAQEAYGMDIAQVAQTLATALVGAMATDAWGQIRSRAARLWSGGEPGWEREINEELEAARHALVAADEDERARRAEALVNDLRGQLKERLRHDLDLADPFDRLATAITEQARQAQRVIAVSQHATAGDHGTVILVGHDLIGHDPLAHWRRPGQ
jgi:hypothetical protein